MKKIIFAILFVITISYGCSCSADIIAPPEDASHPYVYLSDEFVAGLKNDDGSVKSEYESSYTYLKNIAKSSLPAQPSQGYLGAAISNQLAVRALMYALGEFDISHARATIEYTLEYLENPKTTHTYSISMYKDYGTNAIQTGALIYDWCYDAFKNDAERNLLAERIMAIYDIKADLNGDEVEDFIQQCRPDNVSTWSDIAGKAVGQPLIYNTIAATALYDYNHETFYDVIMPKIQGDMAEIVKMYGTAGALTDGSISYTREYYTYYISVLFQRLAGQEKLLQLYGDQTPIGYKMLYSRTPYGGLIRQGDDFYGSYKMNTYFSGSETVAMGLLANIYGDEYLRFQYLKENYGAHTYLDFLTMDCSVAPKLPDDLPLAYETKEPRSEIMARTSWQDGINAPTVLAYMNMNERRTGDHDHSDVGNFQLYYKGPLTMQGGVYNAMDWGIGHWTGYYTRTASANCITVTDPDEIFNYGSTIYGNDGGQRIAKRNSRGEIFSKLEEHKSEVTRWATTESTYIGPNKNTPAFSYIKGDITPGYSESKMESYKRSMVFMDTFNETYPGVMIVFDRVVSKNADFQKKWLLQAVADPQISGDKIIITNTTDGANGKLVNETLLPESVSFTEVGGIDKYISGGVEYPAAYPATSTAYRSGFRVEVSPTENNKEDIFLNAMFVTDADGNAPDLPMIKEETDEFVGVTTLDRQVYFSKNGEKVASAFTVTIRDNNSGGDMLCFIGDVAAGKWKISGTDSLIVVAGDDECLTFAAAPGTYTISPADEASATSKITWDDEKTKEKLGDFVIKFDESYIYLPDETLLYEDEPYISADTAKEFGVNVTAEGNVLTVESGSNVSKITVGESSYTFNGSVIEMEHTPLLHNGKIYIPVLDVQTALSIKASYVSNALLLLAEEGAAVSETDLIAPVSVLGAKKGIVLYDGVAAEEFSFSSGDGADAGLFVPITYDLGSEMKKISSVKVYGPGTLRGYYSAIDSIVDVYYSADGNNFYRMPFTVQSASGVNTLVPDTEIYARYVKFLLRESADVQEFAVYGTNAAEGCAFIDKNVKYIDKNRSFETYVYIKNDFESAALYFDENEVCTVEKAQGDVYKVKVPSEKLAGTREHTLYLKVKHQGAEHTDALDIILIDGGENTEIANIDFSQSALSQLFKTHQSAVSYFEMNSSMQNSVATQSLDGGKYLLTINPVTGSNPWMFLNKLKIYSSGQEGYVPLGDGVFEVKFDLEISDENLTFALEPRTRAVNYSSDTRLTYPASGAIYYIFKKEKGLFEVTLEIDTVNSYMRIYTREIDAETGEKSGDKKLYKELYFSSDSLGQIRFNFGNTGKEAGYFKIDNLTLNYREMRLNIAEFYTEGDVLYADIDTALLENSDVKIIKVIKKDGKLLSFDIESESVSAFETPDDFFTSAGYVAEVYVTDANDITDILEHEVYSPTESN